MQKYREYGKSPFNIILVHGGPGAWGEMAPVAKQLSPLYGVLEPFQTKPDLGGQVHELYDLIKAHAAAPVILVGHSWGAWLSAFFTAQFPEMVKKLILVGCGPFLVEYATDIDRIRLRRMTPKERQTYRDTLKNLQSSQILDIKTQIRWLGELCDRIDQFNPKKEIDPDSIVNLPLEKLPFFEQGLAEVLEMRKKGALMDRIAAISVPVVAIHGDYDPHPSEGVRVPLTKVLSHFKFYEIPRCGHTPWLETDASVKFYEILIQEINA